MLFLKIDCGKRRNAFEIQIQDYWDGRRDGGDSGGEKIHCLLLSVVVLESSHGWHRVFCHVFLLLLLQHTFIADTAATVCSFPQSASLVSLAPTSFFLCKCQFITQAALPPESLAVEDVVVTVETKVKTAELYAGQQHVLLHLLSCALNCCNDILDMCFTQLVCFMCNFKRQ